MSAEPHFPERFAEFPRARIRRHMFLRADDTVWSTCGDAAEYLAYIAYPDNSEREKRAKFVHASLAWSWKTGFGRKGGRPPKALQGWDTRKMLGAMRPGLDRIENRRLSALSIACARLQGDSLRGEIERWRFLDPDDEYKEGSIAEALQDKDRDNQRRLLWRESRPTLAMAYGFIRQANLLAPDDLSSLNMYKWLLRGDWVAPAIETAQAMAKPLAERLDLPRIIVPHR